MQCPECLSHNDEPATFCNQCGARLDARPSGAAAGRGRRPGVGLVLGAVVVIVGVLVALRFLDSGRGADPAAPPVAKVDRENGAPIEIAVPDSATANPESDPFSDAASEAARAVSIPDPTSPESEAREPMPSASTERVTWARLEAVDVRGEVRATLSVPIVGDGWVCVPTKPVLGAQRWNLISGDEKIPVTNGNWQLGEPFGWWRTDGVEAEALVAYAPGTFTQPPVDVSESRGRWVFSAEGEPARAREVRQDGSLVGFRIPVTPTTAITGLWAGRPLDDLGDRFAVSDFYRQTFEGGREEAFLLARDRGSNRLKLTSLANSLRLPKRLDSEETPPDLTDDQIGEAILRAGIAVREEGASRAVSQVVNGLLLEQIADPRLLELSLAVHADTGQLEIGLDIGERWVDTLAPSGDPVRERIDGWLVLLYDDLIARSLDRGNVSGAWAAYRDAVNRYASEPEIHLRGVELLLTNGDWRGAEADLKARRYPREFNDRVVVLQSQIDDLKSLEGKIVLRFPPGSRSIPATALLEGSYSQEFIVDTGASITTIPRHAADTLGIDYRDPAVPRIRVQTAGGEVRVPRVVLSRLDLGGWEVRDVAVIVHDLPGIPNQGLLGTNVLGRFRMDLRTDRGILVLEPR